MIDAQTAWEAFTRRDRTFDGRFVIGVLTTGIYCRPSCAARQPQRQNVRFFADSREARDAGLRACKRCRPDEVARDEAAVLATIDEIKSTEGLPQLTALAQARDQDKKPVTIHFRGEGADIAARWVLGRLTSG